MKYDITVLTLISQGTSPHLRDQITFYRVGDSVREFVAGSCKATLSKLIRLPEDKSPSAWNLKYQTIVRDSSTQKIVSDTKLITFPGMDQSGMASFKTWAIDQLRETADAINNELVFGPIATKKRNKVWGILKMLYTRI